MKEGCFIGSADVVALYPSLNIEKVTEVVADMIKKSSVTLEGVDYDEIALYLALTKNNEELTLASIDDICPKRKKA